MSSIFERVIDHSTSHIERNIQVPRYVMTDADLVEFAALVVQSQLIGTPPSLALRKLPEHPTSTVLLNRVAEEVSGVFFMGVPLVAKRLLTTVKHRPLYRYC
jgi:hypothetical protein